MTNRIRPVKGYYLQDGKRVPTVTTIATRAGSKGALATWAKHIAMK
jgi:hypothetical protein